MRWISLVLHHLWFVNLSFWRNPGAAFFGMIFPLMVLSINSLLLGKNTIPMAGKEITFAAYYVASMSVFAVIMTCFTNLATSILFDRDQGRLKRLRGTPTPVSAYIAARLLFAVFAGLLASGLCVAVGVSFFGVPLDVTTLPGFFACIAFGAGCLSAIALAVAGLVPNAQAGPAILNAVTFPILFISSVFYPMRDAPAWIETLAGALPARPLAHTVTAAFFGLQVETHDLLVLLAWGVVCAVLATRTFKWQPAR